MIEKENSEISVRKQTELLNISRSSIYYQPTVNEEDIVIMNAIDKIYTGYPFYGSRRIRFALKDNYGIVICREHVQRLMRIMGLEAIYPKKKGYLSQSDNQHKVYPYLLKGFKIKKANQVWGTDITYVRLEKGWAYLTAILDWFSRYVISWMLSQNLEADFCLETLRKALKTNTPKIFNSDQDSRFTSQEFTNILLEKKIQISMDGRGRCLDNIFTERLWRTVKQENIYLNSYRDIAEAEKGLKQYFDFYNNIRRHQSLDYQTPKQIYSKK